jgi:GNAT superfamily N-acetyltransferase
MIIRAAVDADAPRLAALLAQLGYPADPRDLPRRLARLVDQGAAVAFVAESEGTVVGLATAHVFAAIHSERDVAWLTALVVAEEGRHQGVGRALVAAAEGWARALGCSRLSVTTALHRDDAHTFYDRLGYEHSGRRYSRTL